MFSLLFSLEPALDKRFNKVIKLNVFMTQFGKVCDSAHISMQI
jgi:hypothetical protein